MDMRFAYISSVPLYVLADNPQQTSRVPVYIRVLDVNDNAPTLAYFYDTFVCENAKLGQVNDYFNRL